MFSVGFVIASTRFKTGYEHIHAFEATPLGSTSKPLDGFTSLAASKPCGGRVVISSRKHAIAFQLRKSQLPPV
jgi:hypothetical protein